MRPPFTKEDLLEITSTAFYEFKSTTGFTASDSEAIEFSDSDSDTFFNDSTDLSEFDSSIYGCDQITSSVEQFVEANHEACVALENLFETSTSNAFKDFILNPKDEENCVGLKLFEFLGNGNGNDEGLVSTCVQIGYWCCCNTFKKVSPIISEATINLIN